MKTLIIAAAVFAAAVPAMAQNVSINIGQPGFYGHIELGGYAPPPVYYTQPVIVERQVRYVGQPVYLRVPQGHRKHWNKHCRQYNACGQQVFFVQDGWYNNTYAPRYREQHRPVVVRESGYRGDGRRDERHDGRRDDRHDDRGRDEGHGKGHGNGNGHGKGHDKHGD
ncbi:MAG: hypothetical protein JWR40_2850 [Massilia sp.]|jgi:hypothetical protein|nr:hypothetical protein [Massilia sp.]MDB5948469.1 hypothetical protein [Massilia sp.]